MKGGFWVIIVLYVIPSHMYGETLEDMFMRGVNAYKNGSYEEAKEVYTILSERYGMRSSDVYVNLGASEFALGEVGKAIYHFHQAIKAESDPKSKEIAQVNLERVRGILNHQMGKGSAKGGVVFSSYSDVWIALFGAIPALPVTVFMVRSWIAFLICLIAFRVARAERVKHVLKIATISLFSVFLVLMVLAVGSYKAESVRVGVILKDNVAMIGELSATEPLMRLPEGLEVRVMEEKGGYVKVRLPSGTEGFVQEKYIGIP